MNRRVAAAALGVALVSLGTSSSHADVDLTQLDARVTALESTAKCMQVAPVASEQLHHSLKRVLVTTNSGAETMAHPSRFVWVFVMPSSCAKDLS